MPVDQVKGELEQVESELELNLATNRNVIDLYQQRQAQVRVLCCQSIGPLLTIYQIEQLTQDLAEEEARAEKIRNTIETARVCFSPDRVLEIDPDRLHRPHGSLHSRPSFLALGPNFLLLSIV